MFQVLATFYIQYITFPHTTLEGMYEGYHFTDEETVKSQRSSNLSKLTGCPAKVVASNAALENSKHSDEAAETPSLWSKKLKPMWRGIDLTKFVSLVCLDQSWVKQTTPEGQKITGLPHLLIPQLPRVQESGEESRILILPNS